MSIKQIDFDAPEAAKFERAINILSYLIKSIKTKNSVIKKIDGYVEYDIQPKFLGYHVTEYMKSGMKKIQFEIEVEIYES